MKSGPNWYQIGNKICSWKNIYRQSLEKEYLLNERAEAATSSSYSATGHFSQRIYFVLVAKNYEKYRPRCLVHEFSFTDIF